MLDPGHLPDVFDVVGDVFHGHRRDRAGAVPFPGPALRRQERRHERHHAHPAVAGQPGQHVVRHVARVAADRPRRRMTEDHRGAGGVQGGTHSGVGDVRQVDEHADPVHLGHHLAAEVAEPADPGHVGGAVRPAGVLVVGQGQVADAQLVQHPQDGQRVADAVPALGPDQAGDPAGPERRLQSAGGRHQLQPVREPAVHLPDQVDLLQRAHHGRRRGQVTRHVDGPELGADPPRRQPGQIGAGQRLVPVQRELLQRGRRHRLPGQDP
ncbi:hypothetical protein GCM10009828_034970 [Actinoplanes couchii]|uniref:Uncharacterized protein n=1 Tax=Actinoplanes couchii TaxID=403638 RepID=A0ABQ3X951_9ACTN|nr:hypothetical protein Aco03nite_033640 [Actinoplanes couchii]